MNIHIVHLPVLQSLATQIRMCTHDLTFLLLTFNFSLPAACFLEAKWFVRMLFLELNISLHPLRSSFPPRRHKFSPGNSSIRSRRLMFFGSELPLSLYFPVLLLGTRPLEIKALFTWREGNPAGRVTLLYCFSRFRLHAR